MRAARCAAPAQATFAAETSLAAHGPSVRQRQRRGVEQRPREFQADGHVGELMLDRLERPDGAAELHPLPGVPDTGRQQGAPGAEQLRGAGQRAEVVRVAGGGGHGGPAGQQLPAAGLRQLSRLVHRLVPGPGRRQPHGVVLNEQHQGRGAGVGGVRQPRWQGQGGDQVPGGQPGQPPGQAIIAQPLVI